MEVNSMFNTGNCASVPLVANIDGNGNNNGWGAEGSWGEYLQAFFDSSKVKVQNYANGGRSSRNFINEGSLDKIKANIKAGDYLFIQFGHNDCANGKGYIEDRYVPLGQPDANGIYPVTAGTKVATPSSLTSKYGDTFYSYDCGGTYKWYLKQYIDAAKAITDKLDCLFGKMEELEDKLSSQTQRKSSRTQKESES